MVNPIHGDVKVESARFARKFSAICFYRQVLRSGQMSSNRRTFRPEPQKNSAALSSEPPAGLDFNPLFNAMAKLTTDPPRVAQAY
jgi:hypothetical protein